MKNKVLTVVMANSWVTYGAIVHEQEWMPWERRSVRIELTPEQMQKLQPREVGTDRGKPIYEFIAQCWLEDVDDEGGSEVFFKESE